MIIPVRSRLFWSAVTGLVAANVTGFVAVMARDVRLEGALKDALLAGLIGLLVGGLVQKARALLWLVLGGAAVSLLALGFSYLLFVVYTVNEPFRSRDWLKAFSTLLHFAPAWTMSQFALVLMLIGYWRAGEKLGLR